MGSDPTPPNNPAPPPQGPFTPAPEVASIPAAEPQPTSTALPKSEASIPTAELQGASTPVAKPEVASIPAAEPQPTSALVPRPEVVPIPAAEPQAASTSVAKPQAALSSQRKIEANRANAQKSTGPTSRQGKKNSSRNAIKHGLLSKEVVITTGEGKEDESEFLTLLARFRDHYQPEDIAAEMHVEEIAISYWRSKRALRCERAAITLDSEIPVENPELTDADIGVLGPDAETRHGLLRNSRGLRYLLRVIENLRKQVQSTGRFPLELRRWLPPAEVWNGGFTKKAILAALDKEIQDLTNLKVQTEGKELDKRNATRDLASIPSKAALDRLHRYDTSNVRTRRRVEQRLDQRQAGAKNDEPAGLKNGGDTEKPEHK